MIVDALIEALGRPTLPAFRRLVSQLWLAADDRGVVSRQSFTSASARVDARANEIASILGAAGAIEERDAEYRLIPGAIINLEGALALVDAEGERSARDVWTPVATIPDFRTLTQVAARIRQTAGTVFSLIERASTELWIVTPFLDPASVQFLTAPLASALGRGVVVRILTSEVNRHLAMELLDGLHSEEGQLRLWFADDALTELGMHAKAVVCDRRRAYLGSANLTSYGMKKHFELGALLEGPSVEILASLFEQLGESGREHSHDDPERVGMSR